MTTLMIASRYLLGRKLRTFLTTLAVVFGVFVIFGMNIIVPTLVEAFVSNVMAAAGQVDMTITEKHGETFSASLADKIVRTDGIKLAEGYLQRTMNLPQDYFDHDASTPDQFSGLTLTGIDPEVRGLHSYPVADGRFLNRSDTSSTVITHTLADAIGITVGDKLIIPTPRGKTSLTVVGLLPASAVPGNEEVLVTLTEAQYLLGQKDKISAIDANFATTDQDQRDLITQNVEDILGSDYQIGNVASGSALLSNIQIAQFAFNMFGFLALLMGGFIIFNTFRTVVAERRHDIGILRALGASRGQIVQLILAEGFLQGVIGTGIGLVLGYGLGLAALAFMGPLMEQFIHVKMGQLVIPTSLVVTTIGMGIGITVLAGLIPALRAGRVTPLEALRPSSEEVEARGELSSGAIIGIGLILLSILALLWGDIGYAGVGILLFLAGLVLVAPALLVPIARAFNLLVSAVLAGQGTSTIAEANLSRQPSRGAVTASATMIGLAVIVAMGGMTTSVRIGFLDVIRKSLGSDYLLIPPAVAVWETNVGASADLANRLRAVPGVDVVSTLRPALTEAERKSSSVLAIDPVQYPKVAQLNFSQGDSSTAYQQLGQGRNVILNGILATQAGVGLGDNVRLATPAGQRTYQVVGVAGDYLNAKLPTLYISQANLKKDFGKDEDVFFQINLTPGADPAAVQPRIEAILTKYPQFRLVSGSDFYEQNRQIFDTAFLAYDVLMGILAVPSLIALVNTLAIAVIERTREIGMLRATGATRGQVRQMVLIEALLLAGVGTLFGVMSGLYLGYVLVSAMSWVGYPVSYFFPTEGIVVAIVVGLTFGALAAIIPSRQAARLEIVQALQYE
jgi:putative ABC transport system permease protein